MRKTKAIDGLGWFVFTLSGLAAGDINVVDEFNDCDGRKIIEMLSNLAYMKLHRVSGKGWNTIEHPDLGLLQWRYGVDVSTISPVWAVRLNGQNLLIAGPSQDRGCTYVQWVGRAASAASKETFVKVSHFLGTVEDGMTRHHPWRWRHYPAAS